MGRSPSPSDPVAGAAPPLLDHPNEGAYSYRRLLGQTKEVETPLPKPIKEVENGG